MAYKNKVNFIKAPATSSYVDFEPKSELKEEEGVDTLIISLPGFKKEQLRVQVSNAGILKVSGEKPENAEGTRKRVFVKETKVPEGCDVNKIRTKFTNCELHVIMPKKVASPPPPTPAPAPAPSVVEKHQHKEEAASTSAAPAKSGPAQMPKPDTPVSADHKQKGEADQGTLIGKMGPITAHYDRQRDQMLGLGSNLLANMQGRKTVAIGFGVAMVAMVAVGAYVAYNYGSSSSSSSSYMED